MAWNPRPAMNQVIDIQYNNPLTWSAERSGPDDVYLGARKAAYRPRPRRQRGYAGDRLRPVRPRVAARWTRVTSGV